MGMTTHDVVIHAEENGNFHYHNGLLRVKKKAQGAQDRVRFKCNVNFRVSFNRGTPFGVVEISGNGGVWSPSNDGQPIRDDAPLRAYHYSVKAVVNGSPRGDDHCPTIIVESI